MIRKTPILVVVGVACAAALAGCSAKLDEARRARLLAFDTSLE